MGFTAPKAVGGGGNSWFKWDHVLEQIGYICNDSGLPILLSYRESAANLVYRFRSPGPDRTLCAPCCDWRPGGDGAFIVYGVNEEKNDLIAVIGERDDSALEIPPIQTMGFRSMGVGRISLGHKIPMSY